MGLGWSSYVIGLLRTPSVLIIPLHSKSSPIINITRWTKIVPHICKATKNSSLTCMLFLFLQYTVKLCFAILPYLLIFILHLFVALHLYSLDHKLRWRVPITATLRFFPLATAVIQKRSKNIISHFSAMSFPGKRIQTQRSLIISHIFWRFSFNCILRASHICSSQCYCFANEFHARQRKR